ncbi:DegT/DnrJ/EryC1/StrS family aminotransferase [Aeromonas salmonicida]|uniref:DegT/DnrJ/EryC1/StrS family aminotransferase n=1 Tax=Aeromonas salmonicida TaxID=645 RepID=UPI0022402787|nr:DegT/DnrJ/EryC1/StrS aminotransferase family protein [Aeromonas salmonicida]
MHSMIPVYQPDLSGNEKKYVIECLDSSWISSKGEFIQKFEREFANFTGMAHAASVSNGTVALHLALLALDVGPGDEVIVPTFTYIASVNAINYVGATPVFVDVEPLSWQLDCDLVGNLITEKTKAIMAVHIYGQPSDMVRLKKIAQQHKLYLIEDGAEAFGSLVGGCHIGHLSDISTYSFFGNKTVTTGEGGMVTTNSAELDRKIRHLKGQGLMEGKEYWHDIVGYNYRMTNICAAIGLAQLEKAEHFIRRKREIADFYRVHLQGLPLEFQQEQQGSCHSWWMFSILTENRILRDKLRNYLTNVGVETRPLFPPIHFMPMYRQPGKSFPISEGISERGMNLPSWPGMTDEMLCYIVDKITGFYK